MEKISNKKKRVLEIIKVLDKLYPEAGCSLEYKDPLQLLVATQLAAQCTDARVNIVCKSLFQKYKNVKSFAESELEELEQHIKSTGFYHNKAKNLKKCCEMLLYDFDGVVPNNMEDLLKLPGVGRKTANLVLGDIFKVPSLVIDTHAKRLSYRIGLTEAESPEKIEYDLMEIVPKAFWTKFCHQLVFHGREVCNARKPKCEFCDLNELCNYQRNKEKQEGFN